MLYYIILYIYYIYTIYHKYHKYHPSTASDLPTQIQWLRWPKKRTKEPRSEVRSSQIPNDSRLAIQEPKNWRFDSDKLPWKWHENHQFRQKGSFLPFETAGWSYFVFFGGEDHPIQLQLRGFPRPRTRRVGSTSKVFLHSHCLTTIAIAIAGIAISVTSVTTIAIVVTTAVSVSVGISTAVSVSVGISTAVSVSVGISTAVIVAIAVSGAITVSSTISAETRQCAWWLLWR